MATFGGELVGSASVKERQARGAVAFPSAFAPGQLESLLREREAKPEMTTPMFFEWLANKMGDHDSITFLCDRYGYIDAGNLKYAVTDATEWIRDSDYTAHIIETTPVQLVVSRRALGTKFLDWVNMSGGDSMPCWNDFVEFGEDRIHVSEATRLLESKYDCKLEGQGTRCRFVARRKRTQAEIDAAEFAESLRANFVPDHGVLIDLLKTEMRRVSKFQRMICVKRVQDGYQTDDNIYKVPECPYAVLRSAFPPPFRFTEERDGFVILW